MWVIFCKKAVEYKKNADTSGEWVIGNWVRY